VHLPRPRTLARRLFGWALASAAALGNPAAIQEAPRGAAASSTEGWTVLEPSSDSRTLYVSSSTGDDDNDGLSEEKPKRSIAAAKRMLRKYFPDRLLLKKGDAWDESLGEWNLCGRSASERMVVSSYGSGAERPLLRTGTKNGLDQFPGNKGDCTAIVGLHFLADTYTGSGSQPRGIQLLGEVRDFLVEDCCIEGYETNLVVQGASEHPGPKGRHKNIAIRRCVVVDAYSTGTSNAQGIFASGTDGLLLEENVFDRNGWRDDVKGSEPTWFRHNVYLQNLNTGVVFRGNVVARTDGVQARSGGIFEDNLLLRNAIGVILGGGGFPEIETDGVEVTARRNVVLDGGDLQEGSARGWGFHLSNLRKALVDGNVIAHNTSGHAPFPVVFDVANGGRGVEKTVFSNNVVFDWGGPIRFAGSGPGRFDVLLEKNRFQNEVTKDPLLQFEPAVGTEGVRSAENVFHSIAEPKAWMQIGGPISLQDWRDRVRDTSSAAKRASFPDASRTIASYHASIGGAPSLDAFMVEARKQSRANWRPQYTAKAVADYIRAGFGL
jgi:hypothetical protein